MTAEDLRLAHARERTANWKRWGPYLSERQWGTVREDYSEYGDSWGYFPHDHARSRAYRWGEDGLLGITDRECRLCFALALWNGKDPILKERLFGLTNGEGNHGEDVKECYYYLDSSPTHSYLKALYRYPQAEFPYARLVHENGSRSRFDREFELEETGIFEDSRYFDVLAEYAKAAPDDVLIRITISNRGPEAATVHVLPTLWFRNTWSWGCSHEGCEMKPRLERTARDQVGAWHASLGQFDWVIGPASDGTKPTMLFTDNETNVAHVFGVEPQSPYTKDSFHEYVIHGMSSVVRPDGGTKAAARYVLTIPAGGEVVLNLRLIERVRDPAAPLSLIADPIETGNLFGAAFERVFADRIRETDAYYAERLPASISAEQRQVARQAYAGLLWSKQFYHYSIREWLDGDPDEPPPPPERKSGRNAQWTHLFNRDVISMPDKWEYPWYAAWDLAFHMIPFARIDPDFAKEQLILLLREWYMHPNGQIPAYEFAFDDVNPPVHAWAAWRVYKMSEARGRRDVMFLKRVFHKLLINFTWWVNRKDVSGKHLFAGGFLGLDNIGVFDRSQPLPTGGYLEQADGTAWMAFFCSTMLSISLELARCDASYEDVASKFLEHFVEIVDAMHTVGGVGLWDYEDGFYYDVLKTSGYTTPLRIRSMVGIIPLFAVEVLEQETIDKLPGFKKRMEWFLNHRRDLAAHVTYCSSQTNGDGANHEHHRLLAIPSRERLERVLKYVLDENEFLSPYGIRALSRVHKDHPYVFHVDDRQLRVSYVSGESTSNLFGGNSNWRGPVWLPVNFLLIEALERYHHFYGDRLKVEFPTGSGTLMNLKEVARELSSRLTKLFLPGADGARPCHGGDDRYADDPHWKDFVLFYEYFDGDDGRGLGASHQTGWTALVAKLMEDLQRG